MGSSRLGICPNIIRFFFCLINAIILVLGVIAVGIGIYLLTIKLSIGGAGITAGGAIILVAGLVTSIIAGVGFVGAVFKWRVLLIIYAIFLIILVVLQIVAGVVGFVYKDELASIAKQHLNNFIANYTLDKPNDNVNKAVDTIQEKFQCCGSTQGPIDWNTYNSDFLRENNNSLPKSCDCSNSSSSICSRVTFEIDGSSSSVNQLAYNQPCFNATRGFLTTGAIVAGSIGIVFGLFEVLGIVVSIGLCICITMADKSGYEVV